MEVEQELLRLVIFGRDEIRRYTQDSPVLPSVWMEYGKAPEKPVDLLLTPHRHSTPGLLAQAIHQRVARLGERKAGQSRRMITYNDSYAAGWFTFGELFCVLLPLTGWYQRYLWPAGVPPYEKLRAPLVEALQRPPGYEPSDPDLSSHLIWLARIAGIIEAAHKATKVSASIWNGKTSSRGLKKTSELIVDSFLKLAEAAILTEEGASPLWLASANRRAYLAVRRSRETVKADVTERAFNLDFAGLRWAIIDSGIDAGHPAFRRRDPDGTLEDSPFDKRGKRWVNQTRILETYDFTRIRELLTAEPGDEILADRTRQQRRQLQELQKSLLSGRMYPWDLVKSLLRVPHDDKYRPPTSEHGTHVAGILAGDWQAQDSGMPLKYDLRGICPALELFDLRVFDEQRPFDEFSVIAALQFVRFLNSQAIQPVVHGVNVSISMIADVDGYACGRTPVCEECERLVSNGVVTVVAAGNAGYQQTLKQITPFAPYQNISVTDPGNAEGVITVGSTHRVHPHTYGVSYFSSRGPTADGRRKPDLIAPGEKIMSPVPGDGNKALDGTSTAAPHVSGAAAALMARHRELIGQPARVKRILMDTATDLGREYYFQGAGLVDIFRALQSV